MHFVQAKKYSNALNGVFLAYPSDRVGQAVYVSEKKQQYREVGLLSLTLFRSHVIRKVEFCQRQSEQIWSNEFDDEKYRENIKSWRWVRSDGLPATALNDGCFWTSYDTKGKESHTCYRLPFSKSDWVGLGLLYGATCSTSLDRYFSTEYFIAKRRMLGWKSFYLWNLVLCDLAEVRSYGNRLFMFSLSGHAHFLEEDIRQTLRKKLGETEWNKLLRFIDELREQHKTDQERLERSCNCLS
jgi:hypothetical protein